MSNLKKVYFIFFCFAFIVSCSSLSRNQEEAELHLRIGTSYLSNGNYPLALKELLHAEELDPRNPVIQNNLGLAYFVREKYDLAENHTKKAVELEPNYSDARNNLGRIMIERGKYTEAIREINIVIEDLTYPNPEKAYINLGIAQFNQKNYDSSLKAFTKALDIQRESCLANNYYGRILYEKKDFFRATEALDRANGLCRVSQFDEPLYYSALSFYNLGDKIKASARFEELIRMYPNGKYVSKSKSMLDLIK